MIKQPIKMIIFCAVACAIFMFASAASAQYDGKPPDPNPLSQKVAAVLRKVGFTGRIESTLESRLGRKIDPQLANVGRLLWFDTITGLNNDNTCGGCHSPTNGFGDTQSIAIGIQNNGIVGPQRSGPRNMRRSPMVINSAFYPNLMWNSRFAALSGNPFDNLSGFLFPPPEGLSLSYQSHLLVAQAFIPPTERTEAAGFDFPGDNNAIRTEVINRLNQLPAYRKLFSQIYPEVKAGAPVTFDMFAKAIAEFEYSLTFANAPIDRFARGEQAALTESEKKGALLFFGTARCSECHSVAGQSNEMFSDFQDHVAGIPQLVPGVTNNTLDGAGGNEDFGKEEITGSPQDRYKFRTTPLRNLAVQSTFMHNGAFTSLEDTIRYHLYASGSAPYYSPANQHLDADLLGPLGPMKPVLARLDPLLAAPVRLTNEEFNQLYAFVRCGLLDPRAKPENLRQFVPQTVPSGRPGLVFEFPAATVNCR